MTARVELVPLMPFPMVEPGDSVGEFVASILRRNEIQLRDDDVLVVAQKIVSKAENCYRALSSVQPTPQAIDLAAQADKDPRQVQLILDESREVLRVRPGVIIVEHRNGYVHANAGIDKSNIESDPDDPRVLLLPHDPDASAAALRISLQECTGASPYIIINDSFGRAWRNGTVGIAIATAGMQPLHNQVGDEDLFGNVLEVTQPAVADELAAAASLVMGQAAEACPVVLIRGAQLRPSSEGSRALIREKSMDLFR